MINVEILSFYSFGWALTLIALFYWGKNIILSCAGKNCSSCKYSRNCPAKKK